MGTVGAKEYGDALKSNSTLTNLFLCNNQVSDDGAKALANVLKTNSNISNLDLDLRKTKWALMEPCRWLADY